LASPNQYLYTIEAGAEPAGHLWVTFDPRTTGNTGFVYDLFVAEPFRRLGVATEAMRLLEVEAARLGARSLALHVFAFNQAARALYQKLGYEITNLRMAKEFAPALSQESAAQ
jgi:ribosomal protein S18 acetylase RimI-like enzyme